MHFLSSPRCPSISLSTPSLRASCQRSERVGQRWEKTVKPPSGRGLVLLLFLSLDPRTSLRLHSARTRVVGVPPLTGWAWGSLWFPAGPLAHCTPLSICSLSLAYSGLGVVRLFLFPRLLSYSSLCPSFSFLVPSLFFFFSTTRKTHSLSSFILPVFSSPPRVARGRGPGKSWV